MILYVLHPKDAYHNTLDSHCALGWMPQPQFNEGLWVAAWLDMQLLMVEKSVHQPIGRIKTWIKFMV